MAEVLRRHAPGGVAIEEPFRPLVSDHAVAPDPSRPACVRAYLRAEPSLNRVSLRRRLRADLARVPWPTTLRTRRLGPSTIDEWAEAWKAHFGVEKVGRRLVVRPSWIEYAASAEEIVLDLDPGMAFGTGQHATTRLCLRSLEDYVRPGARVLDVGAGSGILAIAAVLLGADRATALDTDTVAVDVARANARANRVERQVTVAQGSLPDASPSAGAPALFDLVVANISTAFVLENTASLLEALSSRTGTGILIVSGVPVERRREVETALAAAGGRVIERQVEDGWCALVATPATASPCPEGGNVSCHKSLRGVHTERT